MAKPTPNTKYLLALYQNRLGNCQQAIVLATSLLTEAEFHLKAGLLITDSYYQLENYEACFEQVEDLQQHHPEHLQVRYWQGTLLYHKVEDTNEVLGMLSSLRNEYGSFYLTDVIGGKAILKGHKPINAFRYFTSFPIGCDWYDEGMGLYHLHIAEYYPEEFNLEEFKNLSSQPNMPKLNYYLACIYGDVYKDYKQGIVYLLKSLERLPKHVASKRTLASFYAQVGEAEKSRQQYKEILKLSPGHKVVMEALKNI